MLFNLSTCRWFQRWLSSATEFHQLRTTVVGVTSWIAGAYLDLPPWTRNFQLWNQWEWDKKMVGVFCPKNHEEGCSPLKREHPTSDSPSWKSTTAEEYPCSPGQGACTTTSSGDTCPYACTILNQKVQGLSGTDKLEKIVGMMIAKGRNWCCLQETQKLRTYTTTIRENIIFHHGVEEKRNRKGRISIGITIILGLALIQAWTRVGKPPPITSSSKSKFPGRIIGVTLSFPNRPNKSTNTYHWKAKGDMKVFLWSIYHLVDHADQNMFNEELDSFIGRAQEMWRFCPVRTTIQMWLPDRKCS